MQEIKRILLLGGSNSVMLHGLQAGLKQRNIALTNLALGSSTLYRISMNSKEREIKILSIMQI